MKQNVFLSQKYFIFKLTDMLNNSFHILEEKRQESLQLVIELCIDTYEEMNSTPIGKEKLQKAYSGLVASLAYQLSRHPFRKLEMFQSDFAKIRESIESSDKSYELYMSMKSLKKKIKNQHIGECYFLCLQDALGYREIDILIEALVSDWLYIGYSLYYLNERYQKIRNKQFFSDLESEDIHSYIEKICMLNGEYGDYRVIIPYQVNSDTQREYADRLLEGNFEIKKQEDFIFDDNQWIWKEGNYASKTYKATDLYKAIMMAKKEFSNVQELFDMWQNTSNIIKSNKIYGCIIDERLEKFDSRKLDNTKLINYFDKRRKEQIMKFISLKNRMQNDDVDTLERILHMLHTAKSYNIQNRFLNFWSALEYIIYPVPKNSIIEKARTIVPAAFCLYYVKNKMNIFWERLSYSLKTKAERYPECKRFLEICKEDQDYNVKKMIAFLQDKNKYEKVLDDISFHLILEREMRELIMLLTEPKKIVKTLKDYSEEIVNDLNSIYRLRNQVIHSSKGMEDKLEYISLRLYRYVNSLVSTILYYKEKNADTSIIEILNSIQTTYQVYMEYLNCLCGEVKKGKEANGKIVTVENGYKIVRPKYIFLE